VTTKWESLKHAYGNAADIPTLLASLSPQADAKIWNELWSRLCHQGTVYSASFAVLPTLADVAAQWKPTERAQAIALAAFILACIDSCPDDVLRSLEGVVPRFQELCRESLAETGLSTHDFIYLLQAARSFEGDQLWGQELDHLASGEFPGACPRCGVGLYLVIGEYGFFTTTEEWVQRTGSACGTIKSRPGIKRTPIEPNNEVLPEVGRWLYQRAEAAQQNEVAGWIRHVFGTSVCPSCGERFQVQDVIDAD
jgi:hypothetical protein